MAESLEGNPVDPDISPDKAFVARSAEEMDALLTGDAPVFVAGPMRPPGPALKSEIAPAAESVPEAVPGPAEATPEASLGDVAAPPEAVTHDLDDEKFADEFGDALKKVRSLAELKQRVINYLADHGNYKDYIKPTYEFVHPAKGGGAEDRVEGWFGAIPGDKRSELLMQKIDKAREVLDKRGAVRLALDKRSLKGDLKEIGEHRDRSLDDAYREIDEAREKYNADLAELHKESILDEAYAENDEFNRLLHVLRDDYDRKLIELNKDAILDEAYAENEHWGPAYVNAYAKEQGEAARRAVQEEIDTFKADRDEVLESATTFERKGLVESFNKDARELVKKRSRLQKEAIEKAYADHTKMIDSIRKETAALKTFSSDTEQKKHVFTPDASIEPELSARIARFNGRYMKRAAEPYSIDEYPIDHDDKTSSLMQRIVYKTDKPDVLIVEDWDKTSGKLKRQAILRGADLLVPDYQNDPTLSDRKKKKREKSGMSMQVLSNAAYQGIGDLMSSKNVKSDADTDATTGYTSYINNLGRGGVGLATARRLADPAGIGSPEPGFIAMLRANLEASKKR